MFNNIDFVILSETWKEIDIEVSEFKSIVQTTSKVGKSGRGNFYFTKINFKIGSQLKRVPPTFYGLELTNFVQTTLRTLLRIAT